MNIFTLDKIWTIVYLKDSLINDKPKQEIFHGDCICKWLDQTKFIVVPNTNINFWILYDMLICFIACQLRETHQIKEPNEILL